MNHELITEVEPAVEGLFPGFDRPILCNAESLYPLHILDSQTLRMWVVLDEDLTVQPLSNCFDFLEKHEAGCQIQHIGLNNLVMNTNYKFITIDGVSLYYNQEQWMLENGIIPNQPFQIELYCRNYKLETMDGTEYDCDTKCQILKKLPVDPEAIINYWTEWTTAFADTKQRVATEVAASRHEIQNRTDLLEIRATWFWPDYYDEMQPPTAVCLILTSKFMPPPGTYCACRQLTSAENKNGDRIDALAKLKAKATAAFPQLASLDFTKIPQRTTW